MTIPILILLLGFVFLIKGADWLVEGSVSLAKKYKVSELAIGLTIVAFGTSAPELVVNVVSSVKGYNDVTLGNVVGSNLFNLLLILGVSGIVFPLTVHLKTVWNEIPFSLLAVFVLLWVANITFNAPDGPSINRWDGGILLLFFAAFMVYIFINLKSGTETLEVGYVIRKTSVSIAFILLGLTLLVIGSQLVITNAVQIAKALGISEKIIGITIVSAGTSLPELVTSVYAAFKKKSDIAIGNIIGSNIFNISLILGVSTIISPISFNPTFNFEIVLLLLATVLLFVFMFSGKRYKLDRWEALLFLLAYLAYLVYLLK